MTDTLLSISGPGISPYSARGLTQILEPIAASINVRRSVDGILVNLAADQFTKYKSVINCTDVNAPALNGIWPGTEITVDCISELGYLTASGSPNRPIVTGSSRVEGNYTFFRPQLVMLVVGFSTTTDEYGALVSWQLELEEK